MFRKVNFRYETLAKVSGGQLILTKNKCQDKMSDILLIIIINRWQQAANYSAQMAGESLLYWPSFPPLKSVFVILMCLVYFFSSLKNQVVKLIFHSQIGLTSNTHSCNRRGLETWAHEGSHSNKSLKLSKEKIKIINYFQWTFGSWLLISLTAKHYINKGSTL